MFWHGIPHVLGTVCILLLSVAADNPVHFLYKNSQLVTSSTLNWLSQNHYFSSRASKEIVIGGFEIVQESSEDSYNHETGKPIVKEKPIYVCRALHNGIWVAGGQKEGEKKCTVAFQGNVKSYERYELLENIESAARLNWVDWNTFTLTPVGAVATDKMFVARHVMDEVEVVNASVRYTHYIGTYNSEENLGEITYARSDGTEKTTQSGELLVETEPIKYELKSVKLNNYKKRVIKRIPKILGQTTIKNTGPNTAKMAEAFGYSYNYSMYWGQGQAIFKGLNTSITLLNGTRLPDIIWGIEDKGNESKVYSIDIILEPGTAVNVTLKANYTNMEISYTGELVAYYEDNRTKPRTITGFRNEESMMDVTAEFGPIYFLNNYTLVPTTEPPPPTTTTEPTTTTTTTMTTKLPPQQPILVPKEEKKLSEEETREVDENLIISPKKTDISNMQSDDGGPLSLEDKVEPAHGGARAFESSLIFVCVLTLIFHRIT